MPAPLTLCPGPGPHSGEMRSVYTPNGSQDMACTACAEANGLFVGAAIVWPQNDVTADNVPPELVD